MVRNNPRVPPQAAEKSPETPQKLFGRDFLLLFCMAMCANSYSAVFYCFEQWLDGLAVSPNWRGALISSLFAMVLLCRPLASFFLLKRNKLLPLLFSILVSSCVMLAYPLAGVARSISFILVLRIIQGAALAVFSSCVVAVLVSCIPKGQSARGFAIFSLTTLLPYSIIPALAEHILPMLGDASRLFAITAILGLPALAMLVPLAPRLKIPEIPFKGEGSLSGAALWQAVSHSRLFFVYLACMTFSIMTVLAFSFIKGLCSVTGAQPALFFSSYTVVMILVRVFGSHRLDSLPRYSMTTLCSLALATASLGMAWGPLWAFVPLTCLYGLGLSVLYPLLASTIYDRSLPGARSLNSNLMMSTFDASGMLAPLLGGFVIHEGYGYRGVFTVMALSVTFCGCCMLIDKLRNTAAGPKSPAGGQPL